MVDEVKKLPKILADPTDADVDQYLMWIYARTDEWSLAYREYKKLELWYDWEVNALLESWYKHRTKAEARVQQKDPKKYAEMMWYYIESKIMDKQFDVMRATFYRARAKVWWNNKIDAAASMRWAARVHE